MYFGLWKENWNRIVVTTWFCLTKFFRIWLILKIPWFLKCSSVVCAVSVSSILCSVSLTREVGWNDWGARLNGSASHWFSLIRFKDLLIRLWSGLSVSCQPSFTLQTYHPPCFFGFFFPPFTLISWSVCLVSVLINLCACVNRGVITDSWETWNTNRGCHFVDYNWSVL